MSKFGVIPGPYFPVLSPNTKKYGPEIIPYLDTFHAVAILKNIYVCRACFSMGASVHSLNSNDWYILFSPLELLHEIAKFWQRNWGIKRTKPCG